MKALSVKQPWANLIAAGVKTIETRTWGTNYRGDLLIVSSRNPPIEPLGCAVAIASLVDSRPMRRSDQEAACCELYPRAMAWVLSNVRPVSPFPVRGQMGIYEVECKPTVLSRPPSVVLTSIRQFEESEARSGPEEQTR